MMGLFDTDYEDVMRGNFTTSRKGRPGNGRPLTIWDAVEAANLSMVPGVSDAASLLLAGRDVKRGDYGTAALNSLGALPFIPALGQIFAGPKGMKNLGLLDVLDKAKEMEKAGADPYSIWQATADLAAQKGVRGGGMTRTFPDKQWRFEIGDEAAKVSPGEGQLMRTGEAVAHPDLFKAYPDAQETSFQAVANGGGSYDPAKNLINVQDPVWNIDANPRSTALHELQHAVQGREGFARGGSPELFSKTKFETKNAIESQIDALNKAMSKSVGTPEYWALMDKRTELVAQLREAGLLDPIEILDMASKQYRHLAGEAEARLVQSRANYTPEMRRAAAPWQQFDVPIDRQIVRMK